MLMTDAIEVTIEEAIEQKVIDRKLHAAPIEALRIIAERVDEHVANDYVSLPTMLKYLASLGIVQQPLMTKKQYKQEAEPPKPVSKLETLRGARGVRKAV